LIRPDGNCRKIETFLGGYERYYQALAECIEAGAPVPVDPWDARNGLTALRQPSAAPKGGGRTVDIDAS
jgi:hypothetical protein